VVVDVEDWLDAATAPAVVGVLRQALRPRPAEVVVDLSGTPMVDPYALGVLARARQRAAEQGTAVHVAGANRRVRRVRDLVGLTRQLPDLERLDPGQVDG
jgi:anti-anti-sigma factor